ncbi:protein adenylyltransferase SelO [Alkalilimnicola sp. S0819]|uniref:protein adenylyltransferase SelO n=1 Tax=Alkalilimnicola sp. S0819 TaxID=2613922 RepID=UPI001262A0CE|nr:YdiU family protein [Alkalilimnicola sp. S0819]KAB7619673.1 YdiU family protein [Alkalilimnicola sp. S0819]MPQ17529.1 YdiU family protein [Alkalilimnicola sp. S0819]
MFPEFTLRYSSLPERFYAPAEPDSAHQPRLIAFNRALAEELGFDLAAWPGDEEAAALFAGNRLPPGAQPIAQAYAGHQFGNFVPQLGDGRALLLGEVTDRAGRLRDIQLKGSGSTVFSRGGDGRAPLGPVLREYLVSEAMHRLGVPSTRALAAVSTGQGVVRERLLPGAVLTRVAASHIRVGTFEYFAARGDQEALALLVEHVIARHYPELAERPASERPLALLEAVQRRQAALVARWMGLGFIHGVMNTDNTAISGETLDYGPCAFMEAYDPATVFSAIDQQGRYAYGNQPQIMQWNMARFAETLLGLMDEDPQRAIEQATAVIEAFPSQYREAWLGVMRDKLGLGGGWVEDAALAEDFLQALRAGGADFTLSFRLLADCAASSAADEALLALCPQDAEPLRAWLPRWRERLVADAGDPEGRAGRMRRTNPLYIPRNHQVERVIQAAQKDDYAPFEALRAVLAAPFEEQAGLEAYALPARAEEQVVRTFCGT